ncbi:MAG: glutamate--tRNA ligase [Alphaproteobacteria bacterium]|nr:glutamate--tRNA ligase [Alphaproteobacteria bacterium]
MTVVTRFAPSPTGYLHIGGARTALFNWLFAKHHNGKFLMRIEDTDRARSTQEAIDAIYDGMQWLGLHWDEEPVLQFSKTARHSEVAHQLVADGHAYYCYCSPEELEAMREDATAKKQPYKYDGRWRNRDASEAPEGVKPVVRIKAPLEGEVIVRDMVQGDVRFAADQLDDLIILRSDGTPTYMLAVVVDDHDMAVTHIIRGDDHLNNTARQMVIYNALGWDIPKFAHVPLIHGPDGAKLSKRHGALGIEAYRDMGYLPEALRNYLLRLGWSHGDDETISTEQAIQWFDTDGIGKSPSRLDFAKMENLNGHYIREADNARLTEMVIPFIESQTGHSVDALAKQRVSNGMEGLKQRAKTLIELADMAKIYVTPRPLMLDEKAQKILNADGGNSMVADILPLFESANDWTAETMQEIARQYAETKDTKLGKVAQPLRAGLSGRTISPSVFEMMEVLGRDESLARLKDVC